ncbi:MAG: host-nuclease inhibitor Gam family protein [Acidobacteriota bacterium]
MVKNPMRLSAPAHRVTPQTAAEASNAMGELGTAMAERARLQAELDAEVAKVTAKYQPKIQLLAAQVKDLVGGLQTWAEANKDELTAQGRRSVNLGTGELGWRLNPPKVRVTGIGKVIELLKAKGLEMLVAVKEDINKKAILEDPSQIKGIKGLEIIQEETFWAKPASVDMEEIAS